MNWEKVREREEFYLSRARQAVDTYERHCITPKGLAVPPAQIEAACSEFKSKIEDILSRSYDVCWKLGIEQAVEELGRRGIRAKYVRHPEGYDTPGSDFQAAKSHYFEVVDDSKTVLQQASGDKRDLAHVRALTTSIVSTYSNQAYSQAYLHTFLSMQAWLKSAMNTPITDN